MNNQNITLSIPKDVLHQARLIALQHRQSLSGLLTEYIEQMVEKDDTYQKAYLRQANRLEKGFELNLASGYSFDRESLHER